MSQLDYLLNKASEYSGFISRDLQELQEGMADQAKRASDKRSGSKKRKSTSKDGSGKTKRSKKNDLSSTALKTAQEKDAKIRAGSEKPIFIQPPNLADGCILKDYQLEGVRWLVSLFENGVSGILADEMVSSNLVVEIANST